jgi:hypothetical protein
MPNERYRYRITDQTMAMFEEEGCHTAHLLPAGAIITIDDDDYDESGFVDVNWDNKKVTMFTHDLRMCAELVSGVACSS